MLRKQNTLYAGISNEKGLELIESGIVKTTGYEIQRITDGEKLGVSYTMKDNEHESMFIEIDDGLTSNKFMKDNIIIANVENEAGFDICLVQPDLFTGKKFLKIHNGFEAGNIIYLGIDYSYGKPRVDLPKYYVEVDDIIEETEEQENIEENSAN